MTDRDLMQQALEALEATINVPCYGGHPKQEAAAAALRERLAQPEQEPVAWMTINAYGEEDDIHYENPEGHLLEGWTYKPLYTRPPTAQPEQEPVSMRLPKAGDKVICLEDDSLATVVSLTAGGSPDIVFSDGSHGTYLLREFAELFGYVAPPQPNQFSPDWDAMAVMVEEQQRMSKRILELEALLERQTARIVDLQAHIDNFDGEDR